jgi:hypothetical protein
MRKCSCNTNLFSAWKITFAKKILLTKLLVSLCVKCDFLPACMFSIHEFYFLGLYAVVDSNVVVKKENLDAKQ